MVDLLFVTGMELAAVGSQELAPLAAQSQLLLVELLVEKSFARAPQAL